MFGGDFMKKTLFLLFSVLPFIATACSPSPFDEDLHFLNKHEVTFYFCGDNSLMYNQLSDYRDLSVSSFPDDIPHIVAYTIDVLAVKEHITTDYLDDLFSTLYSNNYVYILFTNFAKDLSFLSDSYFSLVYPNYDKVTDDLFVYCNNGIADYYGTRGFNYSYFSESDYNSIENYRKNVFQSLSNLVKNDLMEL